MQGGAGTRGWRGAAPDFGTKGTGAVGLRGGGDDAAVPDSGAEGIGVAAPDSRRRGVTWRSSTRGEGERRNGAVLVGGGALLWCRPVRGKRMRMNTEGDGSEL